MIYMGRENYGGVPIQDPSDKEKINQQDPEKAGLLSTLGAPFMLS